MNNKVDYSHVKSKIDTGRRRVGSEVREGGKEGEKGREGGKEGRREGGKEGEREGGLREGGSRYKPYMYICTTYPELFGCCHGK